MFVRFEEEKTLPLIFQLTVDELGKQSVISRPVTSSEFSDGVRDCVRLRQAGGFEALANYLFQNEKSKNEKQNN